MNRPPPELNSLPRILELTPEDMTVTVEAGLALGALQKELAKHRQWLPIDPPHAETTSIHDVLAQNLSGPRRFGCGTIREHLIGMKVVQADGRVIKSGGKVVKNVAGYDLAKLFIGAQGSLGTIIEATFKLRPLPEVERTFCRLAGDLTEVKAVLRAVLESELTPVILDAHRRTEKVESLALRGESLPDTARSASGATSVVLGFAGTRMEVEWQLNAARALGFAAEASLDYETAFWDDLTPAHRLSVLPSRLTECLARLDDRPFVARAGNGMIYFRGEAVAQQMAQPVELMRRVKAAYDPKNLLPEYQT